MACGKRYDRPAGAQPRPFAVRDALNGTRCIFDRERTLLKLRRERIPAVVSVDVDPGTLQQPVLGGEAGERVRRRLASHRCRAFHERVQRFGRKVRGGNAGRAPADEKPEPDLLPFGAVHVFKGPEPHLNPRRGFPHVKDVGGVGASPFCCFDERGGARLGLGNAEHGAALKRLQCRPQGRRGT